MSLMERKCFTGSMAGEVEGRELGHVFADTFIDIVHS